MRSIDVRCICSDVESSAESTRHKQKVSSEGTAHEMNSFSSDKKEKRENRAQ